MIVTAEDRAAAWVRRNADRLRAVGNWTLRAKRMHRTQTKPALRCNGMCPLTAMHRERAHGRVLRHAELNGLDIEAVRSVMWSADGVRDGACRAALETALVGVER